MVCAQLKFSLTARESCGKGKNLETCWRCIFHCWSKAAYSLWAKKRTPHLKWRVFNMPQLWGTLRSLHWLCWETHSITFFHPWQQPFHETAAASPILLVPTFLFTIMLNEKQFLSYLVWIMAWPEGNGAGMVLGGCRERNTNFKKGTQGEEIRIYQRRPNRNLWLVK